MADLKDKEVVEWVTACRSEADTAKSDRMLRNKSNFDTFHLRHDFSHKQPGQSTEVLSKQSMAVESIRSFFVQALVDVGDWWNADARYADGEQAMKVRPAEITKLTNYFLENCMYFSHVGNSIQSALLGSLAISKTYGVMKCKPKFVVSSKKKNGKTKKIVEKVEDYAWELKFDIVRQENYYPDPTGKGLYEIEDMWQDYNDILKLSEGDDAIYDNAKVVALERTSAVDALEENNKARETGQNTAIQSVRPKIKLTEYWGDVLDKTTGELVYENYVITIANDTEVLRCEPNPLWHQERPYNAAPLLEVANSVWHHALMDAPTCHNQALIELYNLFVDAAMKQVHAISQLRKDWLDNPAQVSDGIDSGTTLVVNSMCPPGGKVLEPLTTTQIPPDAFNIFNIMQQEFNASALTNDLRQGVMPFRAVKATEVVEASQTITSVFQGIAKNYEVKKSQKELELAWMTTAQNWDKIDKEIFKSLFGPQRGEELAALDPQDVFASTVNGMKFRVYGISLTLSKAQDFRKLTTLLQTISASPQLMEEFIKKYDLGKTLGEIMTSLNIDKYKLEIPVEVQKTMEGPAPGAPEAQGPDQMSQVPQGGSGSLADIFSGGGAQIPHSQFPGSPAIAGGNQ